MFRSALRRACNALQPLATGARASAACVERRALATLCASGGADLAAVGRASPVAAVQAALRRDIHFSSLLRDDAADGDDAAKGLYQVLGEELEHERSTYVPSEIVAAGPPAPFELIEADGDCEITLVRTYGDDEEILITFNAAEVSARRPNPKPSTPPRSPRPAPPVGIESTLNEQSTFIPNDSRLTDAPPRRPPIAQDPYDEDDFSVTTEDSTVEIEDDEEAALHFIVNVSKGDGGEMLEFSCATDGETVEVRNVRYESLADAEEDDADLLAVSYPGPNYDELDEAVQEEFHRYLEARGVDHVLANYIAELHVHKEQELYTDWISKVRGFVGPK